MKTQHFFTAVLLNVLLLVLCLVGLAVRDMVRQTTASVRAIAQDVHSTSINVNRTLYQVRQVVTNVKEASDQEAAYWHKTSVESAKTVHALRQLIDRTDRQLNDGFLPAATAAVHHQDESFTAIGRGAEASLRSSNAALDQLNESLARSLPAIEASAKHVEATTDHIDKATADAQQYVHRLTKPASTARTVGTTVLNVAVHVLQFVKAVF